MKVSIVPVLVIIVFIFEFPMVLTPSIVVPTFILLNLLMAWGVFEMEKPQVMAGVIPRNT